MGSGIEYNTYETFTKENHIDHELHWIDAF